MRNRAKCKLCNSIIESNERYDYVVCRCGEIGINGGNDQLLAYANDFANFLRIDDEGNEIIVTVKDDVIKSNIDNDNVRKPNKDDLLAMLEAMIKNIEQLPQAAMIAPINHYDFCSVLLVLLSVLRCNDEN